ncbi:MAG: DUF1566 domain-containing protein [Bacteroidales bacterium]|nr:DUF1566 domain-containing protein [Bacteroidales bacterium]
MKKIEFIIAMTIATIFLIVAVSCKKEEKLSDYEKLPTFNHDGATYRVAPSSAVKLDFYAAKDYCEHYSVSGTTGWRMPNRAELIEMYNQQDKIGGFYDGEYWSETRNSEGDAFVVSFSAGSSGYYELGYRYYSDSIYFKYYVRPIFVESNPIVVVDE